MGGYICSAVSGTLFLIIIIPLGRHFFVGKIIHLGCDGKLYNWAGIFWFAELYIWGVMINYTIGRVFFD